MKDSITVIIPAYNEEKTIGKVIETVKETVKKVENIDEIIVVSDGSEDNTAEVAKKYNVKVLELGKNLGKGGAIKRGVDDAKGDIILFLDADLIGLKTGHIVDLLKPIIKEEADMTIGVFNNGRFATDLAQKIAPYLSGQRAIRKYIIQGMSDIDITRYGVEVALTKYVSARDIKTKEIILEDLTHIMKEEKLGMVKGFTARIKMYWDIAKIIGNRR